MEAPIEFVLPLFDEHSGADYQTSLQIPAGDKLLDEQAGHDGLSGAGVVGKEKSQRLAIQHLAIYGRDLMGERLNERGVDGENRIEQVREAYSVGFGDQTEQAAVALEAPHAAGRNNFQGRLAVTIEQFAAETPRLILVGQLDDVGAMPRDVHDRDVLIGEYSLNRRATRQLFQARHSFYETFAANRLFFFGYHAPFASA
jgi:hypothetical protein